VLDDGGGAGEAGIEAFAEDDFHAGQGHHEAEGCDHEEVFRLAEVMQPGRTGFPGGVEGDSTG
jgi:hypothetical protein